ncbi:MAG TPA: DUF2510 domain-containing protein [Solirubrobacterales bacterium]|nr:DUF2510 domain-containing protein [Solirubrobacterales bacterium]
MAGSPPPGWYPDPSDPDLARYWDGRRWTEFTGPRQAAPPAIPPPITEPERSEGET